MLLSSRTSRPEGRRLPHNLRIERFVGAGAGAEEAGIVVDAFGSHGDSSCCGARITPRYAAGFTVPGGAWRGAARPLPEESSMTSKATKPSAARWAAAAAILSACIFSTTVR